MFSPWPFVRRWRPPCSTSSHAGTCYIGTSPPGASSSPRTCASNCRTSSGAGTWRTTITWLRERNGSRWSGPPLRCWSSPATAPSPTSGRSGSCCGRSSAVASDRSVRCRPSRQPCTWRKAGGSTSRRAALPTCSPSYAAAGGTRQTSGHLSRRSTRSWRASRASTTAGRSCHGNLKHSSYPRPNRCLRCRPRRPPARTVRRPTLNLAAKSRGIPTAPKRRWRAPRLRSACDSHASACLRHRPTRRCRASLRGMPKRRTTWSERIRSARASATWSPSSLGARRWRWSQSRSRERNHRGTTTRTPSDSPAWRQLATVAC